MTFREYQCPRCRQRSYLLVTLGLLMREFYRDEKTTTFCGECHVPLAITSTPEDCVQVIHAPGVA